jgi:hypothetical protein
MNNETERSVSNPISEIARKPSIIAYSDFTVTMKKCAVKE